MPEASLELDAALQSALRNHPSVLGKAEEVHGKEASLDASRSQLLPSVSVSSQKYPSGVDPLGTPSSTVRVRQPLWAFGRIDSAIALAQADVVAERGDFLRVQRQLLENTAVAYGRLSAAIERHQLSLENLHVHEQLLAQIRRREVGQLASRADVQLALVRTVQAQATAQRYASEVGLARDELRALTMVVQERVEPLDAKLLQPFSVSTIEQRMQSDSADIAWKRQLVDRAKTQLDQTRRSAMPTVYGQVDRYAGGNAAYGAVPRYGVVMEAALDGMGFALLGRIRESTAKVNSAEEDLNAATNEALRLIRSHLQNHAMAVQLLDVQQTSTSDIEALLQSYRRQYEAGTKSWLELLNMLRELNDQRLSVVQTRSDAHVYALRIQALIGDLDTAAGIEKDIQ